MTKRGWLLGLTAFAAAVEFSLFAVWLWLAQRPGINRENFERIREGMAREAVEALLGGPAQLRFPMSLAAGKPLPTDVQFKEEWRSEEAIVSVDFRANGTVALRGFHEVSPAPQPSLLQRILRRLGF